MSDIARGVYTSARRDKDADAPTVACTYTNAINTVRLALVGILESHLLTLAQYRFNFPKRSSASRSLCASLVLP